MALNFYIFGQRIGGGGKTMSDDLKDAGIPKSGFLASRDDLASQYLQFGGLSIDPLSFSGSKADLMDLISRETDECANSVVKQNKTISFNAARLSCSDKINFLFANQLNQLSSEGYQNDKTAMGQFLSSGNNIYIIAAAALILILLVMYL